MILGYKRNSKFWQLFWQIFCLTLVSDFKGTPHSASFPNFYPQTNITSECSRQNIWLNLEGITDTDYYCDNSSIICDYHFLSDVIQVSIITDVVKN